MTIRPTSSTGAPPVRAATTASTSVASVASAQPQPALAGASKPFRIDLSQGREPGSRQWWRLHTGRLRRDRNLPPNRMAQRIVYKRKAGKGDDAAALLNRFFQKATVGDGPSWLLLARHYAQNLNHHADPAGVQDALDLFRATRAAGALRDTGDVVSMAQLLIYTGAFGEAVGLLAGQRVLAQRAERLATWEGVAWLAQACELSEGDPALFASAQDRAAKALRLAAALAPDDGQAADNALVVDKLYPGPTFKNVARVLPTPFSDTPNLRAALITALERHVNYTLRRVYAVGSAVRTETSEHRRQQNVDAAAALREAI